MRIESKLAKRLRELRKQGDGYTQEEIAARAKVDYKYYQSLEGKDPPSPTLRTLEKISNAFQIELWKLLKF